jgi:dihydroxyacid dehydratase/phosphogluconate dehydratase
VGGPIALIQNGDAIQIDAQKGRFMNVVGVSDEEWAKRKAAWKAPPLKATQVCVWCVCVCVCGREREREREAQGGVEGAAAQGHAGGWVGGWVGGCTQVTLYKYINAVA